jgi:hypothetical protein
MKRSALISSLALIFMFGIWLVGPASTLADPVIKVDPTIYDFLEVEVGTSVMTTITISNEGGHNLVVDGIDFQAGSSADFTIPPISLPVMVPPPDGQPNYIDVEVTFTPSSEGDHEAILEILSNDLSNSPVEVQLVGSGIAGSLVTIESILAFFDAGVEAGTIQGLGPDTSAQTNHLEVFDLKLLMVKFFIDKGAYREACTLLWHAYERSDGQRPPPDFIGGDDVLELNTMILQLIIDLGCE